MTLWHNLDRPVILASQSPRRRQILQQMGVDFTVRSPLIENEESFLDAGDIDNSIKRLAAAKASSIAELSPEALVLGMDTVVVIDGRIMGKPASDDEGAGMLRQLSGRQHTVYTAVALHCHECGFMESVTAATLVRFRELANEDIERYLTTGEHRDKAGAYGIQERGLVFVNDIAGCYYNVVGLPVAVTIGLFRQYHTFRKGSAHG